MFEPKGGVSDTTALRALSELADQLRADGLPGRKLTKMLAVVRAAAWKQIVAGHGGRLPAVQVAGRPLTRAAPARAGDNRAGGGEDMPVTVVRVDATIIESATMKPGWAGTTRAVSAITR